ncbi:uncharacterized protein LOC125224967 [Leguminivora glycinivorella]|uniref:uncharacterized protein LOC125224967 n=1 Tax=Leguminivora glycinivorella TaxID=1035111 RepID=UPI00200EC472|nr:uncharacterized protein LOC125224967 [Leguminivora glycinivorella]
MSEKSSNRKRKRSRNRNDDDDSVLNTILRKIRKLEDKIGSTSTTPRPPSPVSNGFSVSAYDSQRATTPPLPAPGAATLMALPTVMEGPAAEIEKPPISVASPPVDEVTERIVGTLSSLLQLTSKQVMKKIERTRASRCQGRPYYQKLPQTPKNEREVTCPARHADVTSRHHAGRAIARAVAGTPEHEAASLLRRA